MITSVRGPADDCTHEQFQDTVVAVAHLAGWRHLHVRRTIGRGRKWVTSTNRTGWPDLFLWHPIRGFAAFELKVKRDRATPEQLVVLAELSAAGAVAFVAYPADWDRIIAVLGGGT